MFHYIGLTTAWHHASMDASCIKQQMLFILFNEDAKLERNLIFIASEAQFCASSEAGISTLQHYLYLASLWALCCHSNLILLSILSGWELRRWIKCLKRKCRTTGLGTKSRSFKGSKIMAKKDSKFCQLSTFSTDKGTNWPKMAVLQQTYIHIDIHCTTVFHL